MENSTFYLQSLSSHILALGRELGSVRKAAELLAAAQRQDRLIHVFGTDPQSAALAGEVFFRAGALLNVDPILDPSLDIAHGAYRSALCMPLGGLAPCILDYYESIEPGDPLILLGSDPALPMFSEALGWAGRKQLKTIAFLNGERACGADVTICTHSSCADALLEVNGAPAGPESAVLTAALLHLLEIETLALLPDAASCTWAGRRTADPELNRGRLDRLLFRIRHL